MDTATLQELARAVADDRETVKVMEPDTALAIREEAENMTRFRVHPPEEEGEPWRVGPAL